MKNNKVRRDRIFIMIAALVVANLCYGLIKALQIVASGVWINTFLWLLVVLDIIAIIGMLWLVENERRRRRLEKQEQKRDTKEGKDKLSR